MFWISASGKSLKYMLDINTQTVLFGATDTHRLGNGGSGQKPGLEMTHKGQRAIVDVGACPGVPVDLWRGPGYHPVHALLLRGLKVGHLTLDQRYGSAGVLEERRRRTGW